MNILAVIVNYRTAEMTMRSVKALASALEVYPFARTVVVDNDSKDGSVEKLRSDIDEAGLQKRAQVFSSPWNGGFAWGNNCAIRDALDGPDSPDYVYLLNSDAFPEKTALERLVTYLEEHPDVGIAGSYIHGADGSPHTSAFRFPSLANDDNDLVDRGTTVEESPSMGDNR